MVMQSQHIRNDVLQIMTAIGSRGLEIGRRACRSGQSEALLKRRQAWIGPQRSHLWPSEKQRDALRLAFSGFLQRLESAVEISECRVDYRGPIGVLVVLCRESFSIRSPACFHIRVRTVVRYSCCVLINRIVERQGLVGAAATGQGPRKNHVGVGELRIHSSHTLQQIDCLVVSPDCEIHCRHFPPHVEGERIALHRNFQQAFRFVELPAAGEA